MFAQWKSLKKHSDRMYDTLQTTFRCSLWKGFEGMLIPRSPSEQDFLLWCFLERTNLSAKANGKPIHSSAVVVEDDICLEFREQHARATYMGPIKRHSDVTVGKPENNQTMCRAERTWPEGANHSSRLPSLSVNVMPLYFCMMQQIGVCCYLSLHHP